MWHVILIEANLKLNIYWYAFGYFTKFIIIKISIYEGYMIKTLIIGYLS
jgi:hypothetical protein